MQSTLIASAVTYMKLMALASSQILKNGNLCAHTQVQVVQREKYQSAEYPVIVL